MEHLGHNTPRNTIEGFPGRHVADLLEPFHQLGRGCRLSGYSEVKRPQTAKQKPGFQGSLNAEVIHEIAFQELARS